MLRHLLFPPLALVVACARSAPAADSTFATESTSPVMVLHNGLNTLDLLGDGTKAQVFVAWRGNGNAHGFSTVTFYINAKSELADSTPIWQLAPFFGGPDDSVTGSEVYRTEEGADCTLGDIRVLRRAHTPIDVILAHRDLGESFADPARVTFDYYRLTYAPDALGVPPYYFKHMKSLIARRHYCDVNEAFQQELGFGTNGLGHGEGGR